MHTIRWRGRGAAPSPRAGARASSQGRASDTPAARSKLRRLRFMEGLLFYSEGSSGCWKSSVSSIRFLCPPRVSHFLHPFTDLSFFLQLLQSRLEARAGRRARGGYFLT